MRFLIRNLKHIIDFNYLLPNKDYLKCEIITGEERPVLYIDEKSLFDDIKHEISKLIRGEFELDFDDFDISIKDFADGSEVCVFIVSYQPRVHLYFKDNKEFNRFKLMNSNNIEIMGLESDDQIDIIGRVPYFTTFIEANIKDGEVCLTTP